MWEISLLPRVPGGEDPLEFFGDKASVVDFNRNPGNALGSNCVRQSGERQLVGKEGISPVSEQPETLCDTVAVPESEGDQVIPRRMEDGDEFRQGFKGGRESGSSTVSEGSLEWERPGALSVGDCLGGTRSVAPFEHWIRTLEGGDLERDPPDRVKANVRIT